MSQQGKVRAPDKDEASIIGTLGKVWKDAQEQIRIHRGKPLPGSLVHEKVRARGSKQRALQASALADLASMHVSSGDQGYAEGGHPSQQPG